MRNYKITYSLDKDEQPDVFSVNTIYEWDAIVQLCQMIVSTEQNLESLEVLGVLSFEI